MGVGGPAPCSQHCCERMRPGFELRHRFLPPNPLSQASLLPWGGGARPKVSSVEENATVQGTQEDISFLQPESSEHVGPVLAHQNLLGLSTVSVLSSLPDRGGGRAAGPLWVPPPSLPALQSGLPGGLWEGPRTGSLLWAAGPFAPPAPSQCPHMPHQGQCCLVQPILYSPGEEVANETLASLGVVHVWPRGQCSPEMPAVPAFLPSIVSAQLS